ncbi:MAG: carboxymuconolactone decarboxylase family protein [Phycisphaerales bacterium]
MSAVDPASDSGPGADLLNGPLKDKQINIFKHLAAHPSVLKAFLGFVGGTMAGALTEKEHEIVALTIAQHAECDYCLAAHSVMAAGAGFNDEQVLSIRRGNPSDDRHAALSAFTRAILSTNGNVSDDDLAAFRGAGYDDAAVIEVIGQIAAGTFTSLFNHVNRTEVDFPAAAAL